MTEVMRVKVPHTFTTEAFVLVVWIVRIEPVAFTIHGLVPWRTATELFTRTACTEPLPVH